MEPFKQQTWCWLWDLNGMFLVGTTGTITDNMGILLWGCNDVFFEYELNRNQFYHGYINHLLYWDTNGIY